MDQPCYCTLLRQATRRLAGAYDAALAPFGINIAQFSLLRMLLKKGPASLTALARRAELDRSTIGRNIRVLERLGLVATRRGDKDQREAVVLLTEQGREVLEAATPQWADCQQTIESRLGREKLDTLRDLLGTL